MVTLSGSYGGAEQRFPVTGAALVGRGPGADLVLPSDKVSWHHARVWPDQRGLVVEDLGSTNGTWVGDHRVTSAELVRPGDRIRFADVRLDVVPDAAPPTPGRNDTGRWHFGDVGGSVVAGTDNRVAGRDQYLAGRDLHHGDRFDIRSTNDYDPWDEVWQGTGPGRVLMVLGGLVALAGFALWMFIILSGFGASPDVGVPPMIAGEIAGIPLPVIAFALFLGGGILAGIGGGMSKAARKRQERRHR